MANNSSSDRSHKPKLTSPLDPQISLKGLDDFSRKFLTGDSRPEHEGDEFIATAPTKTGGSSVSEAALKRYYEQRKVDFIRRAGLFTEDLIAFIVEQKRMRNLSDEETVFSVALANINLRNAYGSPQGNEKQLSKEQAAALLDRFDELCWGAQQYFDANS
jgi:hypothetical protein